MAIHSPVRTCPIVLHDSRSSQENVLCGVNLLSPGRLASLSSPKAKSLYVLSTVASPNKDEISIHVSLAQRFGFHNRTKGTLNIIDDIDNATATHVEFFFRDQHLSRADMWRLIHSVDNQVLYRGHEVHYLGSVTAKVEAIYVAGQAVDSAFVTYSKTKPIFRSGSARYTILIQLSRAMVEYWNDSELMYERLLSGFLPELFRRWEVLKVRHQVTVVTFGRLVKVTETDDPNDFFHVIASDISSSQWPQLLHKLKRYFNDPHLPGQLSLAAKGNMLEAIHMAALDFAADMVDPHLFTTGTSIIAITANAGIFKTSHDMLKRTTKLLMGNSIGVDLVALSPKPLYPVPLFAYEKDGNQEYALPHWVDISFWDNPKLGPNSRWLLPEPTDGVDGVALPNMLNDQSLPPAVLANGFMNHYDDQTFKGPPQRATNVDRAEAVELRGIDGTPSTTSEGQLQKTLLIRDKINSRTPAKQPNLRNSPSTSKEPLRGTKREGSAQHSVHSSRKISLGPKGLALGRGVASTTLSAAQAESSKDSLANATFLPNESSSGLAKQIRQTLARKPSHQSMTSYSTGDDAHTSKPIDIQVEPETKNGDASDPTSLIENTVLGTVAETGSFKESGLSGTLQAKSYAFFGSGAVEADSQWTVSPWVTLLNPCNPKKDNMRVASQYRKWQYVFPRAVGSGTFKWVSMCSPAALPLITEHRPSTRELETHATKKLRRILIPATAGGNHDKFNRLLDQLVALRLAHGFQLASTKLNAPRPMHLGYRDPALMSLGNLHHELQWLSEMEIQIVEYTPSSELYRSSGEESNECIEYRCQIRPSGVQKATVATVELSADHTRLDWSSLDEQVIDHDGSSVAEGGSKLRLVLIPVEPSRIVHSGLSAARELSDEEKRIDGIQRLTQLWQRNRYFTKDDQRHHASLVHATIPSSSAERDPNPLAIEYQTRDPSAVVNAYGPTLTGEVPGEGFPPLFAESQLFHSGTFDVAKLVKQMQEGVPNGVEVRDRRWFTRLHLRCFRGDEMVNWLLRVFKDLHTREEAIAIGNELMRRGIFAHVRHRHEFRDGNYFYQITSGHRTVDYPDSSSMFGKVLRSVPSTPVAENRDSPLLQPASDEGSSQGRDTPTMNAADRKQILLSQAMQYNVDAAKKSDQVEVVNLHYDRIHNPENCYHIQLDWTNTTVKLIREAVNRWTALVEPHGLKLVQLPLVEACHFRMRHPFDQLIPVKLAVRPPEKVLSTPRLDSHTPTPKAMEDTIGYQKALLRKMEFVLDFEAAASFMSKLDVSYSWGRPEYDLTQFVHKSGLCLAQISANESSDFLLLPNRLASQRVSGAGKAIESESVENILRKFTAFCSDADALAEFYEELSKPPMVAPSPFTPAVSASAVDVDVPPMQLPPHLSHRTVLRGI